MAKKNQGTRTDIQPTLAKSVNTREELAKLAGVSHDTVAKVKKIETDATPKSST